MTDVFNVDDQIDDNKDYLSELVGEGKKFASAADLAKGKAESDRFIERLIAEKEAMRKELDARETAEEIFRKLQEKTPAPPPNNQQVQPPSNDVDINQLVDEKFQQLEKAREAKENEGLVLSRLQQTLGPDFKLKVNQRAQELGMDGEFVRNLMQTNPNAALAIFVPQGRSEVFTTPPSNRVNTSSFGVKGPEKKDFAYYEKLRKQIGEREYWSAKVQQEIWKQAQAMGDDFYS